jgi:N-acetylneuraminic acid mutarotase
MQSNSSNSSPSSSAAKVACLAILLLTILTGTTASASGLGSRFFGSDPAAQAVLAGTPYDINDPAWLVGASGQNRDTFAYKIFAGLFMLGYQTEIAVNGISGQIPQRLALNAFQSANGLPQSNLVTTACLLALDQQLSAREVQLASIAQGFQLYDHMQPLHPNDISQDTLAAIYTLPMRALPKFLQMSTYEEVQCINGQCNGFIQDPAGNGMGWPIDLTADFRFVGAYFDPPKVNTRLPSAAVHVQTVLHEYAHYLDGFYQVLSNNPQITKFKLIDTTGFYAIGYDLSSGSAGCYTPRSYNPADWITKYAAQLPGYGNCAAGKAVPDEDWAESFSMYVASGRDFRAAAQQSALVAQRYAWIRDQVFSGLEYDTDLVRDTESGCNDVYLYGATGVPAYAHCSNSYLFDFTLKPLAASIDTVPSAPLPGAFAAQGGVETSTPASSNTVTVAGINWPSAVSVSGGEYSVNGGAYLSAPGTVNNGDTVRLHQTSSASYSTRTDTVLTVGGISSSFSVTTRTPLQPAISGTPAGSALTGAPYSFTPSATNTLSFALTGSLPPGLSFDPATGVLSGTPSAPGNYGPMVISALNGNLAAALPGFSITVSAPPGSFSQTGSLITGRLQHTATALLDGKVLAAGGWDDTGTALPSAELYDPATGSWSQAAPLLSARAEQSATLLPDGSVLIVGGFDDSYTPLASAELFDPTSGVWSALPSMSGARSGHSATLLADGRLLLAGGTQGMGNLASAELFDPATKTWQPAAPMGSARSYHSATRLQNGKVLVAGGYDADWDTSSGAELYDPASGTWSAAAPLPQAGNSQSATELPDGTVLVAGGNDSNGLSSAGAQRYHPASDSWSQAGPMSSGRAGHTATLLPSGAVLVTGGRDSNGEFAGAEVYNPLTGGWAAAGTMRFAQANHSASLLGSGQVLLAGGSSGTAYAMALSQLFTQTSSAKADLTLSLAVSGTGSGTIVSTPAGIATNLSNSATFPFGTQVSLHAAAAEFSLFSGWRGDCAPNGSGDCQATMNGAKSVSASFVKDLTHGTRIGDTTSYHATLQSAYDLVPAGVTVKMWSTLFNEDVVAGLDKTVVFLGGYHSSYASRGDATVLRGTLRIRKGTLAVDGLVLRP